MKVVYTLVKQYDRYLEFLYTYKSKKRAKKACKKLVNETRQLGFHVTKEDSHFVVTNAGSVYEYELYIQPTDYKGGA